MPIDGFYNCDNKIIELYKDFSLDFSAYSRSVSIKLADKDWDWEGYGIKRIIGKDPIKNQPSNFSNLKKKCSVMKFVRQYFTVPNKNI